MCQSGYRGNICEIGKILDLPGAFPSKLSFSLTSNNHNYATFRKSNAVGKFMIISTHISSKSSIPRKMNMNVHIK